MSDISADQRARAKAATANAAVPRTTPPSSSGSVGCDRRRNRRRLGCRRACWRSGRGHARSLQLWRLADWQSVSANSEPPQKCTLARLAGFLRLVGYL